MPGSVRLRDGIRIDIASGETIVLDGNGVSGDANVLSHAHGDHLYADSPEALVCSPLTAALARVRRDHDAPGPTPTDHPDVELLNAGHVAGSRAAMVTDPETGRTYLYTGDICTRDRFYLKGFSPPAADVLIVESTYGKPEYVFPDHETLEREIVHWLADTTDGPVLLFGYSLGRAQELQLLSARAGRGRLFVTAAIERVNEVIEEHREVTFGARPYTDEIELGPGDTLVLPTRTSRLSFVDDIEERTDAITAGFSGWAVNDSFRYRGGYDRTFPLSDHCDFGELLDVVEAVDPETVYTHHGFADDLASHVTADLGVPAQSLKRDQSTLADF